MKDWYEKAEDELCTQYNEGKITKTEFDKAMRDLNDEYKASMQEAAYDAYQRELDKW